VPVIPSPLRLVPPEQATPPLDEVYRRYSPYVAAVVVRLTGRRAEIEDLVHDVFVEAARGLGQLREAGAVKGWLATVAVRLARRRLGRRRLMRLVGLAQAGDYGELLDPRASPHDRLLLARVYRLLDELPVDDRVAFCLHHLEGETLDEVARLTRCSCATAKRRIARAQARIREVFGDE
jgi:RNA polymerase sigma-70 factor (ECF subfamily)